MSAHDILMAASGSAGADKLYVDDVFSTYLYTGNGATQTITNGIDLAGNGGLVWIKQRSTVTHHILFDTAQTSSWNLSSNQITGKHANTTGFAFTSSGFSLGAPTGYEDINQSEKDNVSWTFRKAPKFFDCGTYVGNGVAGRQIPHSLGVAPGMVIVKEDLGISSWHIYHRSRGVDKYLDFTTSAEGSLTGVFGISDTFFSPNYRNTNGATYVWYAFAHDTSTEGIIQCGSFTTDGSGNATVNLGWEPQYLMWKATNAAQSWGIMDSSRGFVAPPATTSAYLAANSSIAESAYGVAQGPNATGFTAGGLGASNTFIYLAIRRPNKPPTTGTEVYNAIARTGTGAAATVTGVGFAPDLAFIKDRAGGYEPKYFDRLRGADKRLYSCYTDAESSDSTGACTFDKSDGIGVAATTNYPTTNYINHFFKRAPGVFDICCYTGTGSATTVAHNLGVAPELMIVKNRSSGAQWGVQCQYLSSVTGHLLYLDSTGAQSASSNLWTTPTATTFGFGTGAPAAGLINASGNNYVAYLFATKAGISKVGSYTGNGSSQTINCGFTTGARFVLIKRTDSTGDWYVWDTARGIVAGNDPHLGLNTNAAEVTTNDSIDPDNTGFIVNQLAATNINVTSATYIYLAFA